MPRHVVTIIGVAVLALAGSAASALAQSGSRPMLVGQQASLRDGRIRGIVHDDAGRAIAGVSIMAVGGTPLPVMARSDRAGQFTIALPPGEYILRATRTGYVSTYREPVRIQSSTTLERNIVLVREGVARADRLIMTASAGGPLIEAAEDEPLPPPAGPDHAHSATAWRLRHLKPTALRNVDGLGLTPPAGAAAFKPSPSFVDWMMGESARAAASFFSNTDFTGQVNFLTTSAVASAGGWLPARLPHGIAYLAVGAPVGSAGDWRIRGAMTALGLSSWVVLGEYRAREDRSHAFRAGISYSSQPSAAGSERTPGTVGDRVHSVGGMYGFDRWQVTRALQLDYGLRLDRYDYATDADFISPRFGLRLRVLPATQVTMTAAQHVIAPGANEFLPPPSAGPWLPPERTFAPLLPSTDFRAERVRQLAVGVEQQLGAGGDAPVVGVRRFRESSRNQVVTLFGLDEESRVGHYYVATPGSVLADGWTVHFAGDLVPRVRGSVRYTASQADWSTSAEAEVVAAAVPSAVRGRDERLHDVAASLKTNIPETSTSIAVAFRVNSGYSSTSSGEHPDLSSRFDVELRQALPLRPTRNSRMELMIVLRNLFRDPGEAGSLYDELLTIAPPMRIMGGVQVKF